MDGFPYMHTQGHLDDIEYKFEDAAQQMNIYEPKGHPSHSESKWSRMLWKSNKQRGGGGGDSLYIVHCIVLTKI